MEELLIGILNKFGYPVRRQGSLTEDEQYPEHFFTFWNVDTGDGSHYDNHTVSTVWNFTVNFYSTDPDKTYSELEKARKALKKAGFICPGKGYDVASGEVTHTGRGIDIIFLENEEV